MFHLNPPEEQSPWNLNGTGQLQFSEDSKLLSKLILAMQKGLINSIVEQFEANEVKRMTQYTWLEENDESSD